MSYVFNEKLFSWDPNHLTIEEAKSLLAIAKSIISGKSSACNHSENFEAWLKATGGSAYDLNVSREYSVQILLSAALTLADQVEHDAWTPTTPMDDR